MVGDQQCGLACGDYHGDCRLSLSKSPVRWEEGVLGLVPGVPGSTEQRIAMTVSTIQNNKDPGPVAIQHQVPKFVAGRLLNLLHNMFNTCLVALSVSVMLEED